MKPSVRTGRRGASAFSLVEVLLALGIFSFALVVLLGLFSVGLRSSRDSEQEIQAADLASYIVSTIPLSAAADLTNSTVNAPSLVRYANLTNGYAPVYSGTEYIGSDGALTSSKANAAYALTCSAGTNTMTGGSLSQVYLILSWPAQANPTNAMGHYEFLTYLPLN